MGIGLCSVYMATCLGKGWCHLLLMSAFRYGLTRTEVKITDGMALMDENSEYKQWIHSRSCYSR